MLFLLASSACILYLLFSLLVSPLISYYRDRKGFRKFNNYSLFSAISDWPYCLLSARGHRSRDLTQLHKTSPIIRIGPNNLSFGRTDAIKDIYGHGTSCVKDLKYVITASEHPHLFDVVEKKAHTEKRKRLSAAFAMKHLENWEYKVARTTERLLIAFDKLCTPALPSGTVVPDAQDLTIDFNKWINLFTIEAINYLALSSELGLLEQGDDSVTAEKLDGTLYQAHYRKSQNANAFATSHCVWDYKNFHTLIWLSKIFPSWRKLWREAAPFGDIVYHQANTRLKRYLAGEQLDDFFAALMDDKHGKPYNSEWGEIVGEISAIIDAGADTTAIALSGVLELLIKHPSHLATLREEIDHALDSDEVVASYDKIKNLPFLRACLDEAMRLIPPTSAGLPRRTPPEGARIMGHWIPGDTSVSMPIYTAHHDKSAFPNPEEYNPQRWMDPDQRRRMESCFIPFSTGGRGCIGRNISYLEQAVVLASLVHRYEFALPGLNFELERFEAFNLICGNQPMKLWRREAPL
ncbi:cytochrome protein [Aureobasidium pullulans]|uniref:Cytochrome protein n=2 Tax=Aureobasidium pullulans TaxID=5580 RepID=A0A4S9DU03_AURPU|nr:cytochrome protein [Aureobasidium pullulans]THW13252.1 cytochrome protein [Aureobasidium pullulans]THW35024.1 cytochrome protein [Aureobasidium pullulans]THW68499.1 cytochrome protein [Aureobasidium pullulans]THX24715.1 cytochrome protein [Aureobasidium pullulans]